MYESILNWLKDNSSWLVVLFGGAGTYFIIFLYKVIFNKKNKAGSVNQKITSGNRSTNTQAGRDINK